MSIRRYANPEQFTVKHNDLQSYPTGQSRDFDFNGVKVHAGLGLCCDDTKVLPCAYDATPTAVTGVTAVVFKDAAGANKEVVFAASTDEADLLAKLASALISDGIDPFYRGDDYKGIVVRDGVVRFISTVEIVSLKTGATVHTATKKCNSVAERVSTFTFDVDGSFNLGGTALGPYATGASATIASAITSELGTQGIIVTSPVTVSEAAGEFLVTLYVNDAVTVNGAVLDYAFVRQTWVA